jgi:hypothetical protein
LNGTVKIVLASRCRLVTCTPGSPQGGGVGGCCLGLHRLPPLLKLHRPRQAALFLSRSRSTRTNKSPLLPPSCSQHTRPRLLTCFHLPPLLFPLLQPHLHSRPYCWKTLPSHSQPLLLPTHCQSLMTLICWRERSILTVGLGVLLLISRKAGASIATSLLSLRSGFAWLGFAGVYRKPPFGRPERMCLRLLHA